MLGGYRLYVVFVFALKFPSKVPIALALDCHCFFCRYFSAAAAAATYTSTSRIVLFSYIKLLWRVSMMALGICRTREDRQGFLWLR